MRTPFNGKALAICVVIVAALLCFAASAEAQTCVAPPGTAGIDQYCESIPGADGNHGPSDHTGGGGKNGSGSLPAATRRALGHRGRDGQALLRMAQNTSPASGASSTRGGKPRPGSRSGGGDSAGANAPKAVSGNPLAALKSAVKSGTRAGPGFVWALIAAALLIAGLAWLRFRRTAARG